MPPMNDLINAIAIRTGITPEEVEAQLVDILGRLIQEQRAKAHRPSSSDLVREFSRMFVKACNAGVLEHGVHWRLRHSDGEAVMLLFRLRCVLKLLRPQYATYGDHMGPHLYALLQAIVPAYGQHVRQVKFGRLNTSAVGIWMDRLEPAERSAILHLHSKAEQQK